MKNPGRTGNDRGEVSVCDSPGPKEPCCHYSGPMEKPESMESPSQCEAAGANFLLAVFDIFPPER